MAGVRSVRSGGACCFLAEISVFCSTCMPGSMQVVPTSSQGCSFRLIASLLAHDRFMVLHAEYRRTRSWTLAGGRAIEPG